MLAPYTDTTLWPTFDISTVPDLNNFTLGFIVADDDGHPSWGGYHKVESNFYADIILKVREKDGILICSFGGAAGNELATRIRSREQLYKAYKKVIVKYGFDYIDFDIEGPALYDDEANINRGYAIHKLRKRFPRLHVSLSVPVMPYGLDTDVERLIEITPCDLLNLMTMNFGHYKDMGSAVIQAAVNAHNHTGKSIGITVMIGKNDTPEKFSQEDAKKIKRFQKENKWVKRLSFWSIERDKGEWGPLSKSSRIEQKPWEFTSLLL